MIVLPVSSVSATEPCLGNSQIEYDHDNAEGGTIEGSEGPDVIDGRAGTFTILGMGGDDVVCGGDGDDEIYGGAGTDLIDGGAGVDTIDGGDGGDLIFAGVGNDVIDGGLNSDSGGDWIFFSDPVTVDLEGGSSQGGANDGADDLTNLENAYGSPGPDTIFGDDGSNYLVGSEGNDFIAARNGADVVNGMEGHDAMFGGAGLNDWLVYLGATAPVTADLQTEEATVGSAEAEQDGLSGFESLIGSQHNDFLYGDAGTNYLDGGGKEDTLDGRGGFDTATFSRPVKANLRLGEATTLVTVTPPSGEGEIITVEEKDTLVDLEGLWGSSDWDTLVGNGEDNLLRGDAEVDKMRGAGGNDLFLQEDGDDEEDGEGFISGGTGIYDLVDFSLSPVGLQINLHSGELEGDLLGIESLAGSEHGDTFTGNDRANFFFGRDGDDVLRGKGGRDGLAGGKGEDKLVGGPATDRCVQGEETMSCEEAAAPEQHPLEAIGKSMVRPAALQAGVAGPEDPRRYK